MLWEAGKHEVRRWPNESIKILNFRIGHCKTAARKRFPTNPGTNSREKHTFSKKRAKPQREAKTQRATKQPAPQRKGSTRGGLEGKAVTQGSRRRSREGGFGDEVSRKGSEGRGFWEEWSWRRSRGEGVKDTSRHERSSWAILKNR